MKYAFNKENGKYIGVFSDDFEIPETYSFTNVEPIDLFKPVIDDVLNPAGWIEGLSGNALNKAQEKRDNEVLDNDSSSQIIQNHRNNGQTQLIRLWDKIQRLKDNGQLTPNQFRIVSEVLFDALIPLEFGMWQVAQTKVNATPTASGIIGVIRTQVKAIIDNYVTANY